MNKTKVLITGADGFIGKWLVNKFKGLPYYSLTLLSLTEYRSKSKNIRRISADLVSGRGLEKLRDWKFDLIVHTAGSTDTSKKDHRANDIGTKNLVESLNLIESSHFIYTSSTAIFAGRRNCTSGINEDTSPRPTNEYGRTKLIAEEYLIRASRLKKFKLTILRLSTVHGKNTKKNGLFDTLSKDIKRNGMISRINWPGYTSLVHVDDVCDAIVLISEKPPKIGKFNCYNLYSDSWTLEHISCFMHEALDVPYRAVIFPKVLWKISAKFRLFIPYCEKLLPSEIYNYLWRFGLVIDDTIFCSSNNLSAKIAEWKPRKFYEGIQDVIDIKV